MSKGFNTITVMDYCCNEVRVFRNVKTKDPEKWLEEHDENWNESQCSYMYGKDTEVKNMTTTKEWKGPAPSYCDVCCKPIDKTFIDGRTVYGPWANMCCDCHSHFGVGLGTGKGQKYERDGIKWVKVEG